MTELHLRQPSFTYSACGLDTKNCERIRKFKDRGNLKYIYKNELDKACFAFNSAYSYSKYLSKKTISGKSLKDKTYEFL